MGPVTKCTIEKRKVMKRMPTTGCRRLPRQFCRKTKCKPKKTSCYYKIQMISELYPQESCHYIPKRVCEVNEEEEEDCRRVKRQHCQPVPGQSTTVKRRVC